MIQEPDRLDKEIINAAEQAGSMFRSRYGVWLLGMISFVESALVVPIITDPFLVAYILSNKMRVWTGFFVTTLTSVFGGIVAYALAYAAFDFVSKFMTISMRDEFHIIAERFVEGVFFLTLLGAITPIPYTLVALAAGFVGAPFLMFVLATLLGRGFRYGILSYLTFKFGDRALVHVRKRVTFVTFILLLLGLLYLVLFKL